MIRRRLISIKECQLFTKIRELKMQTCKQTAFISEITNLMDKYDVHFVVEDNMDDLPNIWIVQNDWPAVEVPYDWKSGVINSDIVRKIRF